MFAGYLGVQGSSPHHHHFHEHNLHENHQRYSFRPTKLFVFGDSYADTGNVKKSLANSWKEPYGSTFPGKPAGRFSDGRILTDYLGTQLHPTFCLFLSFDFFFAYGYIIIIWFHHCVHFIFCSLFFGLHTRVTFMCMVG